MPKPTLLWQDFTIKGGGLWTGSLTRTAVPGGWLVAGRGFIGQPTALTFVPDPQHKWNGNTINADIDGDAPVERA